MAEQLLAVWMKNMLDNIGCIKKIGDSINRCNRNYKYFRKLVAQYKYYSYALPCLYPAITCAKFLIRRDTNDARNTKYCLKDETFSILS